MFKNRIPKLSSIALFAIILFLIFNTSYSVNAQNTVDPSFNGGVTDGNANNYVSAVQPDGKILVGGSYQFVNAAQRGYLTRLNADGTIDSSFNAGGSGADGDVLEIVVLANGKILIGGAFTSYNGTPMSRVARLNADGTLDNTFVIGTGVTGGRLTSIQVQPDGKIIIAGQSVSGYNGVTSNGLSRLNADGSFDNTFVSGFTTSPSIEQIVLQTDGKIIIGGFFSSYGGTAVTGFLRLNANGTRDTTFNAGGSGLSEFNAVAGLAIQTDGKILIGGDFTSYNGVERNFIARINTDGSLDTSFIPPTVANVGFVEFFAIQSDGKILAAGAFAISATSVLPLMRMNTDGSLDNSFNNQADSVGYHVTLQADGKVLLTGFFTRFTSGETRNGIVRINSNGSIDGSFIPSFTKNGLVNAIVQQADGKVLVGGNFQRANGSSYNNIARFNEDGTLDSGFMIGTGTAPFPLGFSNSVNALAVQADGKILVGGTFGSFNNTGQGVLVRLNSNGSVDSTFGITGDINLTVSPTVESILVQPDGKIIIGGRFFRNTGQARGLLRLNTNGSIDTTFNSDNISTNNVVYRIIRQTDGKLIIVGAFTSYSGTARTRIARINADGTLDTSFNPGTGANGIVYDGAIQLDGKILISGAFTTINGITQNRIARLNTDGSVDTSFNSGTGADNLVYSLTILPTGKIAIGGTFAAYNGISKNRLARLNADGSLDASFNSGVEGIPSFVRRVLTKMDGKLLIGGTFNAYSGIPRNNLVQLFTPEITGGNQPLLFTTNRDGNNEIYRMNADGTNQQRLTNTPESEFSGFWSPDGQKIAFSRIISTNVRQIWTMNADGTNQVNISGTNAFDVVYRYSPNGQKILFTRSTAVNQSSVWIMNPDGSNKVRLTNDANFVDLRPEWSPNGSQISFSRCTPVTFICDIYTMNADGSNQTNRTASFTDDDDLSRWSADGSKIIFIRGGTASGFRDIFSMNPDGTNVQRLTTTAIPTFTADLIVSPTINKMMFVRAQEGPVESHEIYTMNTDGSNTLNLTNNSLYDGISAWSPDSSKIAFISRREAVLNEIYTMNSDGSNPVRLTFNNANDFVTDWFRPTAPRRTAFDYDGDGKADVSVFRPSNGSWYLNRSADGFAATAFGVASDKIVPADYDGDGKTDLAVFRDGNWYYLKSSDGAFAAVSFGQAGDIPVSGDFDGDGRSDQAVYRNGVWYLNRSTLGFAFVQFGVAGDKPVAADYDGDGKTDIAVYRDGNWYSLRSSDGQFAAVSFGVGTDLAVPADYDGDGRADQAVYRSGIWYLNQSTAGFAGISFGISTDIPVSADYDGDGCADVAVFRDGNWYILQSNNGFTAQFFGQSGDKPTPNSFVP